ncbi:hypothetical protein ACHAW5_005358 [Stephanodiscus triporus]|uniref:Uncharacterized protein n=1 Tax=Stephanodiscus triporus TaxID=2934178 RepID=A0ABD3N8X9_9STRA
MMRVTAAVMMRRKKWKTMMMMMILTLIFLMHLMQPRLAVGSGIVMDDYQDDSLTSVVMSMWIKRRHLLVHDYALVRYLLAPHPSIMNHCLVNKTLNHVDAAERLVPKLLLNPGLVGMDKEREKAQLINTFHNVYQDFSCQVLGKLACLVTSKIVGIGTAERNWKQVKAVKSGSGQRTNTGVLKAKYQVMIYSQYQQMKAQMRITRMSCAGKVE